MDQKSVIIFIDSEFTTLGNDGRRPELLSMGACTLDGSAEFYAEVQEWDPKNVSSFTREEVIPLLWRNEYKKDIKDMGASFQKWLQSFEVPVTLAMDSVWDWSWVIALAEGNYKINPLAHQVFETQLPYWAHNVSEKWIHLNFSALESPALQEVVLKTKQEHLQMYKAHHALLDARCNAKMCANVLEYLQLPVQNMDLEQWYDIFANPKRHAYISDQAAFGCMSSGLRLGK